MVLIQLGFVDIILCGRCRRYNLNNPLRHSPVNIIINHFSTADEEQIRRHNRIQQIQFLQLHQNRSKTQLIGKFLPFQIRLYRKIQIAAHILMSECRHGRLPDITQQQFYQRRILQFILPRIHPLIESFCWILSLLIAAIHTAVLSHNLYTILRINFLLETVKHRQLFQASSAIPQNIGNTAFKSRIAHTPHALLKRISSIFKSISIGICINKFFIEIDQPILSHPILAVWYSFIQTIIDCIAICQNFHNQFRDLVQFRSTNHTAAVTLTLLNNCKIRLKNIALIQMKIYRSE